MLKVNIKDAIKRWNNGEDVYHKEIFVILTTPIPWLKEMGLSLEDIDYMEDIFLENADYEEWDGYNPEYPNNLYLYGIEYEGERVATGYTGIAGRYWQFDDFLPVTWALV